MKIVRRSHAYWTGSVPQGRGAMRLGRSPEELTFSLRSRAEENAGTNPEELLGAAHAGCFSMSLSNLCDEAGHTVNRINTDARVIMEEQDGRYTITRVELTTRGDVPGLDEDEFVRLAEQAKATCPVSRLFASAEITLDAAKA